MRAFCQQHRTSEFSFYQWRKRLKGELPVKFALVETSTIPSARVSAVQVWLASGERLHIVAGADAATLRMVLGVLREVR